MAIIKAVNSRASLAIAIDYITKDTKTYSALISGYNCRGTNALFEMKATKKHWHKTGGRQYKHFIQSFPPDENISLSEAHEIAAELISKWDKFKGYEVCFATHFDRHHIHTHMIVNSVSFENGKKFCYSKKELQEFKDLSDKILQKHNKTICAKNDEITDSNINGYKAIEKAVKGDYESWLLNVILAVNAAKLKAISIENFKSLLSENGITVEWKDNRKYITFIEKYGNKVRDKRLTEIFKTQINKEVLMNEFKSNIKRQLAGTDTIAAEYRDRQADRISDEIERRKSEQLREVETDRTTDERTGDTPRRNTVKRKSYNRSER